MRLLNTKQRKFAKQHSLVEKPNEKKGGAYVVSPIDTKRKLFKIGSAFDLQHRMKSYLTYYPDGISMYGFIAINNQREIMETFTSKTKGQTTVKSSEYQCIKADCDVNFIKRISATIEKYIHTDPHLKRIQCKGFNKKPKKCEWFQNDIAEILIAMARVLCKLHGARVRRGQQVVLLDLRLIVYGFTSTAAQKLLSGVAGCDKLKYIYTKQSLALVPEKHSKWLFKEGAAEDRLVDGKYFPLIRERKRTTTGPTLSARMDDPKQKFKHTPRKKPRPPLLKTRQGSIKV